MPGRGSPLSPWVGRVPITVGMAHDRPIDRAGIHVSDARRLQALMCLAICSHARPGGLGHVLCIRCLLRIQAVDRLEPRSTGRLWQYIAKFISSYCMHMWGAWGSNPEPTD